MVYAAESFSYNTQRIERFTSGRFYFEYDASTRLLISKCSGVSISINSSAKKEPSRITPESVTYENMILEFVTNYDNNILRNWYLDCHPQSTGGGRPEAKNRFSGGLVIYKEDGTEGARWSLREAIPVEYSSAEVQVEKINLMYEILEIEHKGLIRVHIDNSTIN